MDIKSFLKKYNWQIMLGLVFLLSLGLRMYKLGSLPMNFHEDEVLSGYVGRFILENGKDLYNNSWPLLYFNKFGDYYIIFPMYLAGISTFIFGVNEFAVRFPAAILGSLIVFPVYYLTWVTFKNKAVAALAALAIAISPWHLVLARAMSEGVSGSTVFLSAVSVLVHSIRKKNIYWLVISGILFFITYFIYHPFRLYTPLVLLAAGVLFASVRQSKKYMVAFAIITLIFFSLSFYISRTPWGKGRLEQTSIFSPLSGVAIRIQEEIYAAEGQNPVITRIFQNKVVGYGREFLSQYFSYFSPNYLFINGGPTSPYNIPEQGLFFITFLICLSGIFLPTKLRVNKELVLFLLFILLIAPIPSALTYYGSPNIHRSSFMSVILVLVFAYGFYNMWSIKVKKFPIAALLIIFLLVEFAYFWNQYSVQADLFTSMSRNDGYKQLTQYILANKDKYDAVYLSSEGTKPLYYLFYKKDFNEKYAKQFALDARIDSIDNIKFTYSSCPSDVLNPLEEERKKKILVIDRYTCLSQNDLYTQIDSIKGANPLLAFKILVPR